MSVEQPDREEVPVDDDGPQYLHEPDTFHDLELSRPFDYATEIVLVDDDRRDDES